MKTFRGNFQLISMVLYLASFVSFFVAYIQSPEPAIVFQLSYSPLNVTTNAFVNAEEGTIAFGDHGQSLTVRNLPSGILELAMTFSGVFITKPSEDLSETFLLSINGVSTPISFTTTPIIYTHWWFQLGEEPLNLTMVNFAKIEHERMYGVYLQDITIYHHPT